jgi:hypothetical protein
MNGETDFYTALADWKEKASIETETRLYRALKALTLYVALEKDGNRKRLATAKKNGNEEYIPAFTSTAEYEKAPFTGRERAQYSFDTLKLKIMDDGRKIEGIVLNPHGRTVLFPLEAIRRMDSVMIGMNLQKTSGIMGGVHLEAPLRYPGALTDAVRRFMAGKPEVSLVNLYRARRKMTDNAHWLFLVHFTGRKIDLFPALAQVIQPYMTPGEAFELVQGTAGMSGLDTAQRGIIYERL